MSIAVVDTRVRFARAAPFAPRADVPAKSMGAGVNVAALNGRLLSTVALASGVALDTFCTGDCARSARGTNAHTNASATIESKAERTLFTPT